MAVKAIITRFRSETPPMAEPYPSFIHIEATGRPTAYVPYSMLQRSPVVLKLGSIPLYITLSSLNSCLISVPAAYRIRDSDSISEHQSDAHVVSAQVGLGTSFLVTYRGEECEVRLGRRIMVRDVVST